MKSVAFLSLILALGAARLADAGQAAEATGPAAAREALKEAIGSLSGLWQVGGMDKRPFLRYEEQMAKLVALPAEVLSGLEEQPGLPALERALLRIAADRKRRPAIYQAVHEAIEGFYAADHYKSHRIFMPRVPRALLGAEYRFVWEELVLCPATSRSGHYEATGNLALHALYGIGHADSIPVLVAAYRLTLPEYNRSSIRSGLIGSILGLRKAAGRDRAFEAAYECYEMLSRAHEMLHCAEEKEVWARDVAHSLTPEEVNGLLGRAREQAKLLERVLEEQRKIEAPKKDP